MTASSADGAGARWRACARETNLDTDHPAFAKSTLKGPRTYMCHVKQLEDDGGENPGDLGFSDATLKAQFVEEITNKPDFVKTEKTKDIVKRIKREATDR